MQADGHGGDVCAIEALVARQFASLGWAPGTPADWRAITADFLLEPSLFPATRPAKCQTADAFVERMKGLAETKLRSFRERVLGTEVRVFGDVAVALAACEITENEAEVSRGVEMLLLVKDDGAWRIAAQAWDTEGPSKRIPPHLAGAAEGA